ncbi:MAG: LemA family protein, partial [Candidatus Aenigmatarchaeota archaeon]
MEEVRELLREVYSLVFSKAYGLVEFFREWYAWVLLVLFLLYLISTYNRLIGLKNRVSEARAGMDVYLKQRADLVPNLVASVRRYMEHERELLERITFLRSRLLEAKDDKEKFSLEGELGRLLGRLLMVAENYPTLRANENFLELQRSLFEIEDRISASRRIYNVAVTDYNNALEMIPSNFVASLM